MSDSTEKLKGASANLRELQAAQATPAFEFFKAAVYEQLSVNIRMLLYNENMSREDEHDYLVRARVYREVLEIMPGKQLDCQQAILDVYRAEKKNKHGRFRRVNASLIHKWKRDKMQERRKANAEG